MQRQLKLIFKFRFCFLNNLLSSEFARLILMFGQKFDQKILHMQAYSFQTFKFDVLIIKKMFLRGIKKCFLFIFALNFSHNLFFMSNTHLNILNIPYYANPIIIVFFLIRLFGSGLKLIECVWTKVSDDLKLDYYLPDFQLTNSWLKRPFYIVHFHLYWSLPYLWVRFRRLAYDHPRRWQQFQQLYLNYSNENHRFERKHLRVQLFLIRLGALLAFQVIIFFLIVYLTNLWTRVNRVHGTVAWTIQLVWSLNYTLVANYMALWIAINTTLFFTQLVYFIYKMHHLNYEFDCCIKRGRPQKVNEILVSSRIQALVLKACFQFAFHTREAQFANDLLTFDQGQTLLVAMMYSVVNIFMILIPENLIFNQLFLYIYVLILPIPSFVMPCLLGQAFLDQLTKLRRKFFTIYPLVSHSLRRKLQLNLILFGHQQHGIKFETFRSADYSHCTLLKVHYKYISSIPPLLN